jgi:hypothetical protein
MPSAAIEAMKKCRDERGIPPEEVQKVRSQFQSVARYYADVIASPVVFRNAIEPRFGGGESRIPTIDRDRDTGVLRELDRLVFEPNLTTKVSHEKLDYIREVGIAFDAELKKLVENNAAERIVRVNAMRVLAECCRSGAKAHWPTITGLLKDPKTPAEIKYYALKGAENLLAAYDPREYKTRLHCNDLKPVGELVQAVTDCVLNPSTYMPEVAKPAEATPDQLGVINYIRREAIRALGQVRFVTVPGPDGRQPIFPAYTLARVCVSDPALVPSPSPSECAEAAMGLMNMAPAVNGFPVKGFNSDALVEAVTAGVKTFSAPRADPNDRSLPWRQYAIRMGDALRKWPPLFDPTFEATQPNLFAANAVPSAVNDLISRIRSGVLEPMEKVGPDGKADPGSRVDVEGLTRFLEQLRTNPNRNKLLFTNNPDTELALPGKR